MVKDQWCDQARAPRIYIILASLVLISRLHSEANPHSLKCNVRLRSQYRGGPRQCVRCEGSHLCSQLGHNDRNIWGCSHSSVANTVAHSTACIIYILFNDIHTSHATHEHENYQEFSRTRGLFSIQSRQARLSETLLRERRMTLLLTLYAFAAAACYMSGRGWSSKRSCDQTERSGYYGIKRGWCH